MIKKFSHDRAALRRAGQRLAGLLLATVLLGLGAGDVRAAGGTTGTGELGERNLSASTLEIGGTVYHVTQSTIIMDREGNRITLAKLPVRDHDDAPGATELVAGEFSAAEVRGKWVLLRLDLVDVAR